MSKFKIYKASAGSGKTFSLVYEYLKILINNPTEYKHILAVTFTNDATEEMKNRVLVQLKILAENPESSPYLKKFEEQLGADILQIKKRAQESLGNILHDYSNFNISTIDTFFQKILRAFAKDIGLSAAYNLQLDHETAVSEITENVIANTNDQHKQSKWLMKAAIDKIEDGKSWNIREELKNLFKETFKENYQVKEEKIKQSFQNENRIEELQNKIKEESELFENTLAEMAEGCHQIICTYGLTKASFPYKESSFYGWIIKLGEKQIAEPGRRFLSALDNVDNWYAKSSDKLLKESIIQSFDQVNGVLNEIYHYYLDHIEKYNSNQLIKQNLSYFVMFESMVEEMVKYKAENDVLFISDTNQFIKEIIGDNDESFIFEKAGNYFHHYLIDEFQDTSQLQWNNFRRLISNAVSQGHTSLVVGDVKQSIYRFRNGDWRLLHEQAGAEITYHDVILLKENYRSLENIIKFNNSLYKIAPEIATDIYQNEISSNSEWALKFKECYTDQEQEVPEQNKASGGFVKVNVFTKQEASEEEDEDPSVKGQQLCELVVDIDNALKRGYRPNDIAILVFTKKEAYAVSSHLRKYVEENGLQDKMNIVTQSSLNISNSHTVRLIVACLKFLINKKDQVSLAHVFTEYQQYFLKKPSLDFLEKETNEKIEAFKSRSVVIKSFPLQILIEEVIRFFDLEKESNEHIFLQHFKDALYDYLKRNADDLPNFMDWWEESFQKFQVEVPQNEKSLQIITIHKSKGLEFDLVFIPFAEWALDSSGSKADMLWLDLEEEGIKTLPVKYDKKMEHSAFSEAYLQTKFYNYLDKLNLLYVATTRAIRELYIYSNKPKSFQLKELKPNIKTIFNHLLQVEFQLKGDAYFNLTNHINEEKTELIVGEPTKPIRAEVKKEMQTIDVSSSTRNIFDTLAIKQQSADLRDSVGIHIEGRKQTGIVFHHLVANAKSKKEAIGLLNKLLLQRTINKSLFDQFLGEVDLLFNHPFMKKWAEEFTVYSEYSFCINNAILKPDKFFINELEAIVIDFKTGKPMPEYAEQVKNYCEAVNRIFNKPAKGFIYYTQTNQFEPVSI